MPNELFSLSLSSGEIAVYSYLLCCENRETYQCYPSYRTIGKAVGMSSNTVRKYVANLEEKHLISAKPTTIRTKDGHRRNGNLLYTIRPIQEAVEHFHEQQMRKFEKDTARQCAEKVLAGYSVSQSKTDTAL